MGMLLILTAYIVYAAFWVRLTLHTLIWFRSAGKPRPIRRSAGTIPVLTFASAALDMLFFRRLFASNKAVWAGSWTFHAAFLLVVLRHLRYVTNPVPDCIRCVQPFGIAAGYVLAFSLLYVIVVRTVSRTRYVSYHNYLILGLLFLISATGLLMRNFFRPDLIDVKSFIMGIVAFSPSPLPGNFFFMLHFSLVLLLAPYIPFHVFTAPVVAVEARRRQQELDMVMHEK